MVLDLLRLRLNDTPTLSSQSELRLPLLWTAILADRMRGASLAISSGVTNSDDVVKCLLAGADVVMTTSAILHGGIGTMTKLVEGLTAWMRARDFAGVSQMRGIMSWERSRDKSVYTRANYMRILQNFQGVH